MSIKNILGNLQLNDENIVTVPTQYGIQGLLNKDLGGYTLDFHTNTTYGDWTGYWYSGATFTSTGGYSISIYGPPDVYLEKDGSKLTKLYDFNTGEWLVESITLPSDFGVIESFVSEDATKSLSDMIDTSNMPYAVTLEEYLNTQFNAINFLNTDNNYLYELPVGVYTVESTSAPVYYYKGASGYAFYLHKGDVLIKSSNGYYIAFASSTIYWGTAYSTSGSVNSRQYGNIPTSSNIKPVTTSTFGYSDGMYYTSNTCTSLNSTTYLYSGKYMFTLSSTATGNPTGLSEKCVLETYSAYTSYSSSYMPIKQILHCLTSNRVFERYITYSSTYSYGVWKEMLTSTLDDGVLS